MSKTMIAANVEVRRIDPQVQEQSHGAMVRTYRSDPEGIRLQLWGAKSYASVWLSFAKAEEVMAAIQRAIRCEDQE